VFPEQITLVVTTSPLPRHPCSLLLDEVIRSLHRHCHGSASCRLLVVADGYKEVVADGDRSRWKRGMISRSEACAYEAHKRAIRYLCASRTAPYNNAELVEQPCHRGFALGVCRALRSVRTPFVLVVQHDRPMMRAVSPPSYLTPSPAPLYELPQRASNVPCWYRRLTPFSGRPVQAPVPELLRAVAANERLDHVSFPPDTNDTNDTNCLKILNRVNPTITLLTV